MWAAHFAAGVAIKSRVPEAPIRPLLAAMFVPDFVWIGLGALGVEPAASDHFFDGWSHSLVMVLLYASVIAFLFRGHGRAVAAAFFVGVFSHFLLDLPIHPAPLELYPHSALRFAFHIATVDSMRYWVVQLAVTVVLLALYVKWMRRLRESRSRVVETCIGVLALHVLSLPA
jgi:membrane-bound metal-dependent hydrolase YbcI (DUF457 family)